MTLSDEVFHALAKDILSGALQPGARLDEPGICRKFAVSRTPIREALRRLSGTGLVEVTPRKGVKVARIDVEQLNNMFEALAELEGLCARLSAVRMTPLERRRLEVLNAGRQKRIAAGDKDAAREALRQAQPEMQRAAGKGVVHANTVARKLSR